MVTDSSIDDNNTSPYHLQVSDKAHGERLDKYIASTVTALSRNRVKALIEGGHLLCGGVTISDCSYRVKRGEQYALTIPEAAPTHMQATDIPLNIVFEDEHMLVINKPAGLTVHPGAGNHQDTLANALLAHCGDSLSGIGGVTRPGIVHRLDKDTSGLLVVAKTDKAHQHLAAQLAKRTLKRVYNAVCWGELIPHTGTITGNIGRSPHDRKKMALLRTGGKEAITHYRTEEVLAEGIASLVECRLETGRTHQIRVHLSHKGHALIGDPTYGSRTRKGLKTLSPEAVEYIASFDRQALHARKIGFFHPVNNEAMEFETPLPEDMAQLIEILREG